MHMIVSSPRPSAEGPQITSVTQKNLTDPAHAVSSAVAARSRGFEREARSRRLDRPLEAIVGHSKDACVPYQADDDA